MELCDNDFVLFFSALSYCDNLLEEPRSHLVEANVVIRNSENVIPAGDMSPNNKKSILNTTLTSNSKQKNNTKVSFYFDCIIYVRKSLEIF